jgi:hypothetical protein
MKIHALDCACAWSKSGGVWMREGAHVVKGKSQVL